MDKLVYLTYPILLGLLIWGMKVCKKGEWNDEFMSYEQTKYFQGFIAICIMLHHVGQETCASWQSYKLYPGLEFFVPIGFLLVSVFMFCSGYGLYVSYETKPDYLRKGFLRRRVLPLIIGFYASGWLFFVVRIIMHEKMDTFKIISYIVGFGLPNLYAWFALIMPLLYVFFYIAFRFCGKYKITVVVILTFIYTFIGTYIDHNDYIMRGEWWYNCVHLFWIGLIIGKNREKFIEKAKKLYPLKLIVCVVGFAIFWILSEGTKVIFSYYGQYMGIPHSEVVLRRWACLIAEMGATTLFVLLILFIGMKIKIGNRFLGFMGAITLEFYLMHGLVLELFSYRFCDIVKPIVRITNVALLEVVVLVASIPLSLLLKKICFIGLNKNK